MDGLVDGDEAGFQMVDAFEADDGEAGGGKAVFAEVLGEVAFPSGVRGPVERAALAGSGGTPAASCFSEMEDCSM